MQNTNQTRQSVDLFFTPYVLRNGEWYRTSCVYLVSKTTIFIEKRSDAGRLFESITKDHHLLYTSLEARIDAAKRLMEMLLDSLDKRGGGVHFSPFETNGRDWTFIPGHPEFSASKALEDALNSGLLDR